MMEVISCADLGEPPTNCLVQVSKVAACPTSKTVPPVNQGEGVTYVCLLHLWPNNVLKVRVSAACPSRTIFEAHSNYSVRKYGI